jgi:hypothetical protein
MTSMFVVTVGDVIAGIAIILLVAGSTAIWMVNALIDHMAHKEREAKRAKKVQT